MESSQAGTPEATLADRFRPGARVTTPDGPLGTLEDVIVDPATGQPAYLAVREDGADGDRVRIGFDAVDEAASTADEVRLAIGRSQQVSFGTGHYDAADSLIIPAREEVLVPITHEEEYGRVRIERRVETVPYETTVEVGRDRVEVERVAVNRQIDAMPSPRQEGDTLVVPVVEEVLVTEKRLFVREEIRITRYRETQSVPVAETLRREVVRVQDVHRPSGEGSLDVVGATGTADVMTFDPTGTNTPPSPTEPTGTGTAGDAVRPLPGT
ncbi:MAG: hypothetical protein AVDCRST_MAG49-2922 [uncultured Thermomicrobiales bacterium]|uniref:DUF2382 domain-containing protein n=1 Tax=uncultured Thermomicrobiales bacterium TaxID=1645740 RepID=A0A6J4UNZ0_9BACT|nr:MAG: hypothetical protein AVDCRST_MAG49-2922 [uncultured Thermomicrobiales bacterium]